MQLLYIYLVDSFCKVVKFIQSPGMFSCMKFTQFMCIVLFSFQSLLHLLYFKHHGEYLSQIKTLNIELSSSILPSSPLHRWWCPSLAHMEAGSSHCLGPWPLKHSSGRFHHRPRPALLMQMYSYT